MLRQLAPNEWVENGSEVPLCQLPLSVADVKRSRPVHFTPLEPQLPDYSHAVVSIDGQVYLLAGACEALHDSARWLSVRPWCSGSARRRHARQAACRAKWCSGSSATCVRSSPTIA
jgi:hypothetical protein